MARVAFTKVEGLGNDFILIDRRELGPEALAAEIAWAQRVAPRLCERRTGIGADGILLVGPGAGEAAAAMIVVNFDGSRPEMCGNGLRCVAAYVAARSGARALVLDTDAGPKRCLIEPPQPEDPAGSFEVDIDMGPARELGEASPASGEGRRFVGVSMGNPHAVHFVGAGESAEVLARRLGPPIELDEAYAPAKTNVEFARLLEPGPDRAPAIELWVWERGVGITQACGTGACATAAAAAGAGLVAYDQPVDVLLPGGRLRITVPADPAAGVRMRGPAREVFDGTALA